MKRAPGQSPLPWAIEKLEDGDFAVIDATGEIISEPDYESDARLIVAAVNSHADLLAAAKNLAMAFAGARPDIAHLLGPAEIAAYDQMRAAIAKAEQA